MREFLSYGSTWASGMSDGKGCGTESGPRLPKAILIIAGTICLGLGLVGVVLPILPTTPFLLLAAACYARSSQRFYCWLIGNRIFGTYVRNYREGRGLPLKVRAFTISMLWITIGITAMFFVDELWLRAILLLVAVAVSAHVATIRPKEPRRP